VQVALPVLGLAAVTVLRDDPRGRWHQVWGLGLGLTLVMALAPTLWLVAAPLLLGAAAAAALDAAPAQRPAARRRALAAALVAAVPGVLLLPWSLEVARTPGLLVHGPGRLTADPTLVDADLPAWELLLLSPGGAGLPPAWVGLGLLLAALAALLRRDRAGGVLRAWTVALTGLGLALLLARTTAGAPTGGDDLPVWPGVPLQVAAAGLLGAALLGADGLREHLARSAFGLRQVGAAVLAGAAVLLPLLAAATWVARGADEPLRRAAPPAVPPSPTPSSTPSPGCACWCSSPPPTAPPATSWSPGPGLRLGAADVASPAGAPARGRRARGRPAHRPGERGRRGPGRPGRPLRRPARSAAGGAQARAWTPHRACSAVRTTPPCSGRCWRRPAGSPVLDPDTAERARAGDGGPRPRRRRDAAGSGSASLPAGPEGPAARAVRAGRPRLAGAARRPRPRAVTAWQGLQGFVLPAGGGTLSAGRDDSRAPVLALQALGLAVVAVLASPGAARRRGLEPADDAAAPDGAR
jgi:hypothetical protein